MNKVAYSESTLKYGEEDALEYRFIHPVGLRWRCTNCGACCRNPEDRDRRILLLPTDISRLRGVIESEFYNTVEGREPFVAEMVKSDGKCVFLGADGCEIYDNRPLICRTYPFWIERIDQSFIFRVDEDCPGLGKGERLGERFFRKLLKECLSNIGI
ncbi:MAG: YkgJ family cysteine cluster protein [Candidatus Bathyarchaeia archaeon]